MSIISSILKEYSRIQQVWNFVEKSMEKELLGHLRFVLIVAHDIQLDFPETNRECVLTAAIIHDIGRPYSSEENPHELVGSKMVYEILPNFGYSKEEIDIISGCVLRHNGKLGFETKEQEIVSNADAASKVLYHEAFMLLCKKESYLDRVLWCKKYLEKGYSLITIAGLKEKAHKKFSEILETYETILNSYKDE